MERNTFLDEANYGQLDATERGLSFLLAMVRSPRRTRARSYSGQFVTRYLVFYAGWTFERLDIIHSMLEPVSG